MQAILKVFIKLIKICINICFITNNTTKFIIDLITLNSDFPPASWSMTALSTDQDEIVAESGVTISCPDPSFTPDDAAYTNQSVTYTLAI